MGEPAFFGRYRVERELHAAGGYAAYMVRDPESGRLLEVAAVRRSMLAQEDYLFTATRYKRFATTTRSLDHPGIRRAYEAGESDDTAWVVADPLEGQRLDSVIHSSSLPPAEWGKALLSLLDALDYLHRNGIVHRGIAPRALHLAAGRIRITDFGIAARIGPRGELDRDEEEGGLVGTPAYMSPEQVLSPGDVDHRADLFASATVFCRLLTDRRPFEAVLGKALAKERDQRHASAAQFSRELELALQTAPAC